MVAIPLSVDLDCDDLKEFYDACSDPTNKCTLVVCAPDEDALVKW